MDRHEAYSVFIENDKGKTGSGTLFYTKNSDKFYVLTCAHVIYKSESVKIHILSADGSEGDPIIAGKSLFHYSPINEVEELGETAKHSCDIAVIECPVGELTLTPTEFAMYPMSNREKIVAIGYPQLKSDEPLYYRQDAMHGQVEKVLKGQNYFLIRVTDDFINQADREEDIKGFSGSPVWDEEKIGDGICLFGGLIAFGVGNNISRARVSVMNARLIQSLMRDEFGINIETRIPGIPASDVAPGYQEEQENRSRKVVRDSWIENERRKAQTFVDDLKLQKGIDICQSAIGNDEFHRCTEEQKYGIYAVMLEAYRLARDYDTYDRISEDMHKAGVHSDRELLTDVVRYFEALDFDAAEKCVKKALANNRDGNEERVLDLVIEVSKSENPDIGLFSSIIGERDQLLIKPKDDREEESIYQILGFVFGNVFRETGRAIRCLNRSFQISGNYIVLETLATIYYFHSIRNAFIEEGTDRIDPLKIDQNEIEKARDAYLRVLSAADELYYKGLIQRTGLQMFKCFFFMHDNFRIFKHYHDLIKYFKFPDTEVRRDVQLCFLEVAVHKGPFELDKFDALKDHDRKFYSLVMDLNIPMKSFNGGIGVESPIRETDLLAMVSDAEKQIIELKSSQEDDHLNFEGIHTTMINLYGNGILRYHWCALPEVKRHADLLVHPERKKFISLFVHELEIQDFETSEREYREFFEARQDVLSFNEWCHFYTRNGKIEKTKELYDSVFNERSFLIADQSEYFYREYIDFTLIHNYDLTPAIRCFVEQRKEFKDPYIVLSFEMDLNFATCTFNDPDLMLENAKVLLDEGVYNQELYEEKCLIINMLNCRPLQAEKFAGWAKGKHPLQSSKYESMLLIWKGAQVEPNPHWNDMQHWIAIQMFDMYDKEDWRRDPKDILRECRTAVNKAVVVDLWTLYFFVKTQAPHVMAMFDIIYVTHDTVSAALQEINQVNDIDIRRVLRHLQIEGNVKLVSPTLEQQLTVRDASYKFREVHSACLLAKELNCPAFVGEFRYSIPEQLRAKVIRPSSLKDIIGCIDEHKLLKEEP